MKNRAFTLVELLAIIAVIDILEALFIACLGSSKSSSKADSLREQSKSSSFLRFLRNEFFLRFQ